MADVNLKKLSTSDISNEHLCVIIVLLLNEKPVVRSKQSEASVLLCEGV